MTLWDGSFAASILALSVTACAVPPLPKGEALAKPKTVPLCQGLPLRGSWRAATERARTLKYAAAVPFTTPPVKMRLERPAELVGATPLHLLTQTALPLKSPTGAFIATLRSANAVAPNAKLKIIFR